MADDWNGEGYDAEASAGGGLWLRLRQKGEKLRMRICSPCCRYTQLFKGEDGSDQIRKRAAWIVLLKTINPAGKVDKAVHIFVAGPQVYGLIKDLADSEEWGDPTQFDVVVERTEQQGRYYTVTPVPKPMGPISDADRELVAAAKIDWPKVCREGRTVVGAEADAPAQGNDDEDPFADE